MSDFQAVAQEVISNFEFQKPEPPAPSVITASDLPADMPLTNRLDALTAEQAQWVLQNGDAWLPYLKSNGGDVTEYEPFIEVELSDAEKRDAIFSMLRRVESSAIDKRGEILQDHKTEWVEMLEWALSEMPTCFGSIRRFLEQELKSIK